MQPLQLLIPAIILIGAVIVVIAKMTPTPPHQPPARSFSTTITSPQPIAKARELAITSLAGSLGQVGYRIINQTTDQIVLARTYRSPLTWLFTIITFPLGLIFFLAFVKTSNISILITEKTSGGSQLVISGMAPAKTIREIKALAN